MCYQNHQNGDDGEQRDELNADDVDFVGISAEKPCQQRVQSGTITDPMQKSSRACFVEQ